jgi:hypothetical protein
MAHQRLEVDIDKRVQAQKSLRFRRLFLITDTIADEVLIRIQQPWLI